ncbi:MAG: ECF-type sigma factor [Vicinamibacterales bacterium]
MTDSPSRQDVTGLLLEWRDGRRDALDRLVPVVYAELRRVARARLRAERDGHSLQTNELVHEVYLRLVDIDRMTLTSRAHFFAVASRLMRQVLVDHARRRDAGKRGGDVTMVSLSDASPAGPATAVDILALDEALDTLTGLDARLCRVVELKFFGGLTIEETAAALDVSRATVERDWTAAKAWLFERMSSSRP